MAAHSTEACAVPPQQAYGPDFTPLSRILKAIIVTSSAGVVASMYSHLEGKEGGLPLAVFFVISAIGLSSFHYVVVESSKPPAWNPHEYCTGKLGGDRDKRPCLVFLGDSISHQRASGEFVELVRNEMGNVMDVVNCGENGILTYTVDKERVEWVAACQPTYVALMIGTNNVRSVYRADWAAKSRMAWKIPQSHRLTIDQFEKDLKSIVSQLLKSTKAKSIAIQTLPMMGEDLECPANELIRTFNERIAQVVKSYGDTKRVVLIDVYKSLATTLLQLTTEEQRKSSIKVDNFMGAMMPGLFKVKLLAWSYDRCGAVHGLRVLWDSLHLNDTGARVVAGQILSWLGDMAPHERPSETPPQWVMATSSKLVLKSR